MAQNGDPAYSFDPKPNGDSISKSPTTINPEKTSTRPQKGKNAKIQVDLQEKKNYRNIVTQTVWPRREFEQDSQGHQQPTTTITTRPSPDDPLNESGGFSKGQQKQSVHHGKSYDQNDNRSSKVDRTQSSHSTEREHANDVGNVSKTSQISQNTSQYAITGGGGGRSSDPKPTRRDPSRSRSPSPQPPINRDRDRSSEEANYRLRIRVDHEAVSESAEPSRRRPSRSRSPSPQHSIPRGHDQLLDEPTDRQNIRRVIACGSSAQRESSRSEQQNHYDNRNDQARTHRSPETRPSGFDHQRLPSSSPNKTQSHGFIPLSSKQSIRDDDRRKDDHRSAGRQDSTHSNRQESREQQKDRSTSHHSPDRKTDRRETNRERSPSRERNINGSQERSTFKSTGRQDPYTDERHQRDTYRSSQTERYESDDQRSQSREKARPSDGFKRLTSTSSYQQDSRDQRKDPSTCHHSPDRKTDRRETYGQRNSSPEKEIIENRERSKSKSLAQGSSSHSARQDLYDDRREQSSSNRSPDRQTDRRDTNGQRSPSRKKSTTSSPSRGPSKSRTIDQQDSRRDTDKLSMNRHESSYPGRQDLNEDDRHQRETYRSSQTERYESDDQRSQSREKTRPSDGFKRLTSTSSYRQDCRDQRKDRSTCHHSPDRKTDRRETYGQRNPSPEKSTTSSPSRERSKSRTIDQQDSRRNTDKLSTNRHGSSSPGREDSCEDRKHRSNSRRSPGGRRYTRENRRPSGSPDRKDSRSNDRRSPRRREPSPSNDRNNRSTSQGKMIDAVTQRTRSNTGYSPVIRPTGSRSDSSDRRRHGSRYDHRQETNSSSEEAARQSSSRERTRSSSQRKPSSRRTTQVTSPKREELSSSRNTKTKERSDLHTNQNRQSSAEKGGSDNNTEKRRRPSITPLPARKSNENERNGRKDSGTASIRPLRPSPTPPQQETPRRPTPTLPLSKEPYVPIIPHDDPPTRDNSTARPPAQVNAVANVDGLTIQLNIGIQTDSKSVGNYDTSGRVNDRIMHDASHSNTIRDRSQSEYHPNRSSLVTHDENLYETIEQMENNSTTTDRRPSHLKQYHLRRSVVTDSKNDRDRYSSRVEEEVPIHPIESTSVQPEPQRREQRPISTSLSRQSNQFHDLAEQDQIGSDEVIKTTSSIPSRAGSRLDGLSIPKQDQHILLDGAADDFQTPRKQEKVQHAIENRISPSVNADFAVPFNDYGPPRSNRSFQPVNRDGSPKSKTLLLPVLNSSRTYIVERTRAQPTSPLRQSRSNGNFYLGNRTPSVQQEPAEEDANE